MRIIVTSDLHYNVPRSRGPTRAIAKEICKLGGDALVLAGDSAAADLSVLEDVFELFAGFKGARLAVAGNHELWTVGRADSLPGGDDSLHRYENAIAETCTRCGMHYLDGEPFRAGDVAIVGNMGWYDYSYRPDRLKVPLRFYEHKIAPGAAAQLAKYHHLLDEADDLPAGAMKITTRWMDGEYVRLPVGDVALTGTMVRKLREHVEAVCGTASEVVVCMHHLPFAEMVIQSRIANWAFGMAFMGSQAFGEVLAAFPKVRHVYCGHSHRSRRRRIGGLVCTSIGSTYGKKRFEVLEV